MRIIVLTPLGSRRLLVRQGFSLIFRSQFPNFGFQNLNLHPEALNKLFRGWTISIAIRVPGALGLGLVMP